MRGSLQVILLMVVKGNASVGANTQITSVRLSAKDHIHSQYV